MDALGPTSWNHSDSNIQPLKLLFLFPLLLSFGSPFTSFILFQIHIIHKTLPGVAGQNSAICWTSNRNGFNESKIENVEAGITYTVISLTSFMRVFGSNHPYYAPWPCRQPPWYSCHPPTAAWGPDLPLLVRSLFPASLLILVIHMCFYVLDWCPLWK